MGTPIVTQKRGKGKHRYTAPSHRFKTVCKYRDFDETKERYNRGVVLDLFDDPSKTAGYL